MKKFGLALLITALFMLALALSISAADIPKWTEVSVVENMADKVAFGEDGKAGATSRVLMDDGKTYPAYYIFKDSTTLGIDFTEINKKSGITYTKANVVRLEIPKGTATLTRLQNYTKLCEVVVPEGVEVAVDSFLYGLTTVSEVTLPSTLKTIEYGAFYKIGAVENFVIPEGCTFVGQIAFKLSQIESVVIPSTVSKMDKDAFRECKSLKAVDCKSSVIGVNAFYQCEALEEVILENTTEIGQQAFYQCGPIKNVEIPEGCKAINDLAFKLSGIKAVTIPSTVMTMGKEIFVGCSGLKEVHHYAILSGVNMYKDCATVETLEITSLVVAATYSFYGLSGLKEITLPETLTTIGSYAFAKLNVETLVIPASCKKIEKGAFYASTTLKRVILLGTVIGEGTFENCSNLNELFITERITTVSGNPFSGCNTESFLTYYTGSDFDRAKGLLSTGNERVSKATSCDYEDFLNSNYTPNKYMFVYNADICKLLFDGHIEDGNPCVINCSRCAISGKAEKNPIHDLGVNMVYVGYAKSGKRITYCGNEGCEHRIEEDIPALFNCLGLSASMYGQGGIALGFVVNRDAIDEYSSVTGKSVEFGIFAGSKDKIGNNELVSNDGVLIKGIFCTKLSNNALDAFELKVVNIGDRNKDTLLALGAYVITRTDESCIVSYMQPGKAAEGEKYFFTSYNEILK